MDNDEARALLAPYLDRYKGRSYADLVRLIDEGPDHFEETGASGDIYQIEILSLWDDKPGGSVRVIGAIDSGFWRAFAPLDDSFLVRPDGSPVD